MTLRKKISLSFFAFLVLGGLTLAGSYAYLYARAQQDVDAILKRLFAGATIHYDSLRYFPWNESLHLDGLRIGDSDPIRVERIVILQAERDAVRSLVERRGAAVGDAGSYVRLAGDILIEGMLRSDGSGVSRLHLNGLDVFLSSIVWSEDVFAWEPLKFLDEASQVFRFETLAFENLRLPSPGPGVFWVIDLGRMSFSGASDRQIGRLSLSDAAMRIPFNRDDGAATLHVSLPSLLVEKLDMRSFFDGMEEKLAALYGQGNLAPLMTGISLDTVAVSGVQYQVQGEDASVDLAGSVDGLTVKGLKNGLLQSFQMEKMLTNVWSARRKPYSFAVGTLEMENADVNSFGTTFLPPLFLHLDPPFDGRRNTFGVLSFVRNGLVPLPVERMAVRSATLSHSDESQIALAALNIRNSYRDGVLIEGDTEVRSFTVRPDEERMQHSWQTLKRLGYDSAEVWLHHKETFDPESQDLHTTTEVTITDIIQLTLDARMQGFPRNEAREVSAALPQLVENVMDRLETMRLLSAEVAVTDQSLLRRMKDTDEEFRANVALLESMAEYPGMAVPALLPLLSPVVEFLKNGGTMVIALNPQPPVEVRDFSGIMRSLDRVVDRLGVVMTVRPLQAVP